MQKLLSKIGTFTCCITEESISFPGVLIRDCNHIMLSAQMDIVVYRKAHGMGTFQIWGSIAGNPVTLLNCRIEAFSCQGQVEEMGTALIWPSEIVKGKCYDGEIMVKTISAELPALNYFYMGGPLKYAIPSSENDHAVLKLGPPDTCSANDLTGELVIRQTYQESGDFDHVQFINVPVVEYTFLSEQTLWAAVCAISNVRNLFSILADHYIPLISFGFIDIEDTAQEQYASPCSMYFNDKKILDGPSEPFVVTASEATKDFPNIWKNWCQMNDEAHDITRLFYEIVSNSSTGVNHFLNVVQALEVYSCRFRETEAKAVKKRYPDQNKAKGIYLKHRIEDLLEYLADSIDLKKENIPSLAHNISNMRNFFTHYDKNKCEPAYDELFSAGYFLHFVLLVLVYKRLGILDEYIAGCLSMVRFRRITDDCTVILGYESRLKSDSHTVQPRTI